MHFVVIGISHKTAPLEIREKLAASPREIPSLLKRLLQNEDIQEGMLISTCNRVEAYLVAKHVQKAALVVTGLFSEIGGMAEKGLEPCLYVKDTREAVAHLFRVTAGLDSMVVGEPQITGQVKQAYTQAVESQATGSYLNKLVHKSFNVAKKIRTETAIGRHPVSVSYAAVRLAERIFGDLREKKVLLIGAGEMGELAARHLAERKVGAIGIANRTEEKAAEVARALRGVTVPFESFAETMGQFDIVIVSTGSESYIVQETMIQEVMRQRKGAPMFFIDISVPRNIDPQINQIENVYLYDIDHLQGIVEANKKEREKETAKAEEIINEQVHLFLETLSHMNLSPTIQQLSRKFERIRRTELDKYFGRKGGLSGKDREALEAFSKAMVNKILHDPIILMKTEEMKEGTPKYSEILKKLFKLEGEG